MLFKLAHGVDPEEHRRFEHPNIFERQQTTGPARLCIGPSERHIDLLLSLARLWSTPCGILYVLHLPRRDLREPGRYESPVPLSINDVEQFCTRFTDFLQNDGRHHLWIGSQRGELLVYDSHDWIYAYGDLDAYEAIARNRGLRAGKLKLPVPHSHMYYAAHDADEDAVMSYWKWSHSPLRPGDD